MKASAHLCRDVCSVLGGDPGVGSSRARRKAGQLTQSVHALHAVVPNAIERRRHRR